MQEGWHFIRIIGIPGTDQVHDDPSGRGVGRHRKLQSALPHKKSCDHLRNCTWCRFFKCECGPEILV